MYLHGKYPKYSEENLMLRKVDEIKELIKFYEYFPDELIG
jgi:hypothetical protein